MQICLDVNCPAQVINGIFIETRKPNIDSIRRTSLRGHRADLNLLKLYSVLEYKHYTLVGQIVSHEV